MGKRVSAWARWRRPAVAVVVAALLSGLASCTGREADSVPTPTSASSQPGSRSVPPGSRSASPSKVDKVLVIVEENRSVQNVDAHMPFFMSQAQSYGTATSFYATKHPSLPNYLVVAGGSTFGIADDENPDAHRLQGPSVFGQLIAAGRTAKTYAEAMPTNCARRNQGTYVVRHNPWTYFDDPTERAQCEKFDVASGTPNSGALKDDISAGRLPTFGLLVPDVCHDGHDCSAATTDDWLRSWLPTIKNGPDFRSNRLAIVITWDEDDDHSGNHVPMVVIHPSLKNEQVTKRLDQYGLSAGIARIGGIPPLRNAHKQMDVFAPFGL